MSVNLDRPYTFENSSNPYIMDKKNSEDIIEIDGHKITAEYLWSLNTKERIKCLYDVFDYYRLKGFPYPELDRTDISSTIRKLAEYDESKVLNDKGFISNSCNIGLDICQFICREVFFRAKGDKGSKSLEEIFYDDEAFIKVLKNRMGWNTSSEDGTERPYMFGISDKMVLSGIRNSGMGYGVSNFRPAIAKFIYERYTKDVYDHTPIIFDPSAGWGARALAAVACGYLYTGTDPLTADYINRYFNHLGVLVEKCGSEEYLPTLDQNIDLVCACPPYFTLERYSDDESQSYNKYPEFREWLTYYWDPTVKNCRKYLDYNGKFVLIVKDWYKNYNLKNEMVGVLLNNGFRQIEEFQYNTMTNHLSGKRKSGRVVKNNEYVIAFEMVW